MDKTQDFYIPNFFSSIPVGDDLVFGLGVYSPYGLGTEWDEDGITKYTAIKSELKTIFITPAVAWKPHPKISIGAGVSYIYAETEMIRKFPFSVITNGLSSDADVELTGEEQNWGWTAGILAKPTDNLSLGFSYRSETILKFKGDMDVDNISQVAQGIGQPQGVSLASSYQTDVEFEMPLPQRFSFGINYKILPNLRVEVDYERVLWSAFGCLEVDLEDENMFFSDLKIKKDWRDTNVFKLGTELQLSESWAFRAGSFYYETAIPDKTLDPMIPENDRYGFTLGVGYQIGDFSVDVGYTDLLSKPRTVENDELDPVFGSLSKTRYETHVHQAALQLSYVF